MGSPIDPSSDPRSVQAKVIVDATLGPERGHYQKVRYPKLDLAGYVGGSADGPAPTDGRIP
jgi:hypothetical protein